MCVCVCIYCLNRVTLRMEWQMPLLDTSFGVVGQLNLQITAITRALAISSELDGTQWLKTR